MPAILDVLIPVLITIFPATDFEFWGMCLVQLSVRMVFVASPPGRSAVYIAACTGFSSLILADILFLILRILVLLLPMSCLWLVGALSLSTHFRDK